MEEEVNAKWREELKDFEYHLEAETMPSTCTLLHGERSQRQVEGRVERF
jgi:hypothetical protein